MTEILRIERLIAGGDGLAREPGRPVTFVPGSAPGDLVRVEIERATKQHRLARVLEILEPGAGRRTPPCPEAGACGGCPWMFLTEAAQAEAALDIVAAALRRASSPVAPDALRPVVSTRPLGARHRMRLHLDLSLTSLAAGFLRAGTHEVHPAAACLALEPALEAIRLAVVGILPELRARLGPLRAELSIDLPRDDAGVALLRIRAPIGAPALGAALEVLRGAAPNLVALEAESGSARARLGDAFVSFRRGPLEDPGAEPAHLAPGGFLQAGREGGALLISRVLHAARQAGLGPGARVLELFAGSGHFTLPLARLGCAVEASDADERAIGLAARAATGCMPPLPIPPSFRASSALSHVRDALRAGRSFDAVVLDPPRTGAKEIAPLLSKLAPRIIWISCDVPTFARDSALLARDGWLITSIEPLLLFPQTAHFETVAVLTRG